MREDPFADAFERAAVSDPNALVTPHERSTFLTDLHARGLLPDAYLHKIQALWDKERVSVAFEHFQALLARALGDASADEAAAAITTEISNKLAFLCHLVQSWDTASFGEPEKAALVAYTTKLATEHAAAEDKVERLVATMAAELGAHQHKALVHCPIEAHPQYGTTPRFHETKHPTTYQAAHSTQLEKIARSRDFHSLRMHAQSESVANTFGVLDERWATRLQLYLQSYERSTSSGRTSGRLEVVAVPTTAVLLESVARLDRLAAVHYEMGRSRFFRSFYGTDMDTSAHFTFYYFEYVQVVSLSSLLLRHGCLALTSHLFKYLGHTLLYACVDLVEQCNHRLETDRMTWHHVLLAPDDLRLYWATLPLGDALDPCARDPRARQDDDREVGLLAFFAACVRQLLLPTTIPRPSSATSQRRLFEFPRLLHANDVVRTPSGHPIVTVGVADSFELCFCTDDDDERWACYAFETVGGSSPLLAPLEDTNARNTFAYCATTAGDMLLAFETLGRNERRTMTVHIRVHAERLDSVVEEIIAACTTSPPTLSLQQLLLHPLFTGWDDEQVMLDYDAQFR
ncbi:hypothetical protein SDRG_10042 [Saprolegnia diclina VS20]|uniref:Uncharacterized protein n=1 Tax=Saprolegnia diclina (strain VS20) TaxID=1156394 RepID=T0QFC3_SAPDV|nr:hypothetical protein SDRG_10042 [Saprolegnia diclina VS20]EQC32295.1 hypothetical protein SDRG_10042 [Saprolegnia diclina VS20]|eukprot:XP_008614236.1 hypothetical protein SDRG_10042 [Saprolegnia diclina VS20]